MGGGDNKNMGEVLKMGGGDNKNMGEVLSIGGGDNKNMGEVLSIDGNRWEEEIIRIWETEIDGRRR